jgi:hypothetical protein
MEAYLVALTAQGSTIPNLGYSRMRARGIGLTAGKKWQGHLPDQRSKVSVMTETIAKVQKPI